MHVVFLAIFVNVPRMFKYIYLMSKFPAGTCDLGRYFYSEVGMRNVFNCFDSFQIVLVEYLYCIWLRGDDGCYTFLRR